MIFKEISHNRLLFKLDNARGGAATVPLKNDTDYKNIVVADEKQSDFIKQALVKVDGNAFGTLTVSADELTGYNPQLFSGKIMVPDNFGERIAELFAMTEESARVYEFGEEDGIVLDCDSDGEELVYESSEEDGIVLDCDSDGEELVYESSEEDIVSDDDSDGENDVNDKGGSTGNVRASQNSATRLSLILLPIAHSMSNQTMLLSDQLDSLSQSLGIILSSNADIAEMHTKKLIDDWKDRQKKIDDANRRKGILGFVMVAIDVFQAVRHIGAAVEDIATGNDLKAFIDAAIAVYMVADASVRATASTLIIIDPDLANNSDISNMCQHGVAAVAGNKAAAMERTVFMLVSLYDSYTQFTNLSGLIKMGGAMTVKVFAAGFMAASSLTGNLFQFMDLIRVYKGGDASSDMNIQAASIGGIEGLIALLVDKSGLRNQIIKFLSSDAIGLTKADAKMVDQMVEMAFYMAIAMACNYAASQKSTPPSTANGLATVGQKYKDMLPDVLKDLLNGFMKQLEKDAQDITTTMMRTLVFSVAMSQVAFSAQNLSLSVMEYKLEVASAQAKKELQIQSLRQQVYADMQDTVEQSEQSASTTIQSSISVIEQIYKDIQSIARSGANTTNSAV